MQLIEYVISAQQEDAGEFSFIMLLKGHRNDHVFYTKENKRVSLVMGNLEDQDTDVIVNTTSAQMNLNCGAVSSALSRKAGPALQAAVNKKKESTEISGDIVDTETTNCRLCCKNVYHISLGKNSPKSLANLEKVVMDCLKLADASQHQSISLPALGTGILGYPPKDVADIVIDAAIQFSKDYPDSTLKLIRVVLFPSNDSIGSAFKEKIQHLQSGNVGYNYYKCYICSHDNKRISLLLGKIEDQNTDVIVNTTSVKMKLNVGNVSSALHYKAGPALQASVNREKGSIVNHGDIVNTETTNCNLSCKRVFHVSLVSCSSTEWCPKLKRVVMDCLRLADQFKHQSISLPAMGTGNLSYPAQRVAAMMVGAAIQYYNDCPNSTLKLIQFVLLPSDNSTISEFQKEMQHPSQPLTDPDVVLEMPEKWEPMGEEHLKLILLNETSQEYQDVKKNIMETLLNKTIISIKRIQNWRLYQCYMIMKKSMDQKNEGKQNERILFHGTVKTSLHNINNSGFNRNYCGKNGTVYGMGAYFAREAIYSDSYATPDAKTSHKHIYQARVLTGDFCVGDTLMHCPIGADLALPCPFMPSTVSLCVPSSPCPSSSRALASPFPCTLACIPSLPTPSPPLAPPQLRPPGYRIVLPKGDPLGVDFVLGRVDSSRSLAGLRAPRSRIPIVRSDPFVPGAGISPSGRISSSGNLCHVLSDKSTYRQQEQQEQQEPIPRR
ncbi:unnamed protein product [Lampetra fluviatilis]